MTTTNDGDRCPGCGRKVEPAGYWQRFCVSCGGDAKLAPTDDATDGERASLTFHTDKVAELVPAALASLREARAELEMIEARLERAVAGGEVEPLGVIHGVDSGLVFRAFGAVEQAGRLSGQAPATLVAPLDVARWFNADL